jgi:hypothetical protein
MMIRKRGNLQRSELLSSVTGQYVPRLRGVDQIAVSGSDSGSTMRKYDVQSAKGQSYRRRRMGDEAEGDESRGQKPSPNRQSQERG